MEQTYQLLDISDGRSLEVSYCLCCDTFVIHFRQLKDFDSLLAHVSVTDSSCKQALSDLKYAFEESL